jgi:hypothetical protein
MNHWNYIVMAYGAFAVLMAWDYFAPRWSLRQTLRNIHLNKRRKNMQ